MSSTSAFHYWLQNITCLHSVQYLCNI